MGRRGRGRGRRKGTGAVVVDAADEQEQEQEGDDDQVVGAIHPVVAVGVQHVPMPLTAAAAAAPALTQEERLLRFQGMLRDALVDKGRVRSKRLDELDCGGFNLIRALLLCVGGAGCRPSNAWRMKEWAFARPASAQSMDRSIADLALNDLSSVHLGAGARNGDGGAVAARLPDRGLHALRAAAAGLEVNSWDESIDPSTDWTV